MDLSDFDELLKRPTRMKVEDFRREGRLRHLIFAGQLDLHLLEKLYRMADMIRRLSRSKEGSDALRHLLSHKRAMLYFTQPSTRTFLSFMAACQILGITCNEVRNPQTSSEVKRESPFDSIRMFSSYFDVIIMRTPDANFAECCALCMNQLEQSGMRSVPIINGGAGADEHPTQALLDIYTIQRTFQFDAKPGTYHSRYSELVKKYPELVRGPSHKTYAFCGDLGRGRTVRSLAVVLSQYQNVKLWFISPEHNTFKLGEDVQNTLSERGIEYRFFDSLDETVDGKPLLSHVDCLYMTRIQREHNSEQDNSDIAEMDMSPFKLTAARVQQMKDYAPILHPFPRDSVDQEIPWEIDSDSRAMYFRQARNGVWARASLLVHIFDVVDDLYQVYDRFYGQPADSFLTVQ